MATNPTNVIPLAPCGQRNELIGQERGLRQVWSSIQMVSRTQSAVLIQGETGTGKELVARAIHEESLRARGPFVRVNCAAIPGPLLESELFGHERGAFTGALNQTTGRFQLAHTGTLFLDEIGDLPLELQPKLLRALQEQEFERLGSTRTIRVDVRIVAATNQDLEQMVQERRFRADLFYRLNVFPIELPALRERCEDIPSLVEHFVRTLARQMGKQISHIPAEVLDALTQQDWPGNVRELQNFIERAVIVSPGPELRLPVPTCRRSVAKSSTARPTTLAEAERDHILRVLKEVHWVVGGKNGAAVRLGLPRTTLIHRMRKLGIGQEGTAAVTHAQLDGGALRTEARAGTDHLSPLSTRSVQSSVPALWATGPGVEENYPW